MQDLAHVRRSLAGALVSIFVLAAASVTVGACNTTAGLGQDVSATGRAVTNSADKVKQGL